MQRARSTRGLKLAFCYLRFEFPYVRCDLIIATKAWEVCAWSDVRKLCGERERLSFSPALNSLSSVEHLDGDDESRYQRGERQDPTQN